MMKKITFLLTLFITGFSFGQQAIGDELISGGTFEGNGTNAQPPAPWNSNFKATVRGGAGNGANGTARWIRLEKHASTQAYINQDFTIVPGNSYTVTYWYKYNSTPTPTQDLKLTIKDITGGTAGAPTIGSKDIDKTKTSWFKDSFTFTADAGETLARLTMFRAGGGVTQFFIDEISVKVLTADLNVTSGTTTISANKEYTNVNVSAGANLVVNSGITLAASDINLNSTSSSYSSLISEGTITGTVNYKRYTNIAGSGASGGNDLVSSPVTGQTFGSFATANTNLANSGIERGFAPYNNGTGAYENYDTTDNTATTIDAGKGYRAATTDGSNLTYSGSANTGNINVAITVGASNAWNLTGNPYPSYITFATFYTANKAQFDAGSQAIYGYNDGGWTTWNQATVDAAGGELIAPGQGFFVKAKTGGGSVGFTNLMRTSGTSDDFISGKTANNTALANLNLTKEGKTYNTKVYFIENQTNGLDAGYDSGAYQGNAAGLYTNLVEDNTGVELAIQTLGYSSINSSVIPLGIKANQGEQITINLNNVSSNLPLDTNVYLEDNVAKTFTNLNETDFTLITTSSLKSTGRFFLHFTAKSLANDSFNTSSIQIYANNSSRTLHVKGLLNDSTPISIYDIQGRLVLNKVLVKNSSSNKINVNNLNTGVYIVKLGNDLQNKTQKILIK